MTGRISSRPWGLSIHCRSASARVCNPGSFRSSCGRFFRSGISLSTFHLFFLSPLPTMAVQTQSFWLQVVSRPFVPGDLLYILANQRLSFWTCAPKKTQKKIAKKNWGKLFFQLGLACTYYLHLILEHCSKKIMLVRIFFSVEPQGMHREPYCDQDMIWKTKFKIYIYIRVCSFCTLWVKGGVLISNIGIWLSTNRIFIKRGKKVMWYLIVEIIHLSMSADSFHTPMYPVPSGSSFSHSFSKLATSSTVRTERSSSIVSKNV